jgi:uncharacterized protein YbaP (TraB family)
LPGLLDWAAHSKALLVKKALVRAIAVCLGLVLGPIAVAQNEIEEITSLPTPPLWRLTRPANPNSEVWILGTVGAMPRGIQWNRNAIGQLMDGARAVVMPPQADANLIDIGWFLLWNGGKLSLPRGQTLESILPPDLRAKFIEVRTELGRDEDRYKTDVPLRAIFRLQGDFNDKFRLGGGEPNRTIRNLADDKDVPIAPVGKFKVMDAARAAVRLPLDKQVACFAAAMEDFDRLKAHAEIAGRAWAKGDFKTVREHYAEYRVLDCAVAALESAASLNELQTVSFVNAVNDALSKPGKTIVTIGIGPLLRANGVLERLQKQGIAIEAPPEK